LLRCTLPTATSSRWSRERMPARTSSGCGAPPPIRTWRLSQQPLHRFWIVSAPPSGRRCLSPIIGEPGGNHGRSYATREGQGGRDEGQDEDGRWPREPKAVDAGQGRRGGGQGQGEEHGRQGPQRR